jgi:hypothetical protein
MLLYEGTIQLKKELWEVNPSHINIDEVELHFELGILDQADYHRYKHLHALYGRKRNTG